MICCLAEKRFNVILCCLETRQNMAIWIAFSYSVNSKSVQHNSLFIDVWVAFYAWSFERSKYRTKIIFFLHYRVLQLFSQWKKYSIVSNSECSFKTTKVKIIPKKKVVEKSALLVHPVLHFSHNWAILEVKLEISTFTTVFWSR